MQWPLEKLPHEDGQKMQLGGIIGYRKARGSISVQVFFMSTKNISNSDGIRIRRPTAAARNRRNHKKPLPSKKQNGGSNDSSPTFLRPFQSDFELFLFCQV